MSTRRRVLELGAWACGALALLGAFGTFFADGPYLSASKGVEPWVAVWAVGLFGLFMYAPFALHDRINPSERDRDRRWEMAVLGWGALALALTVVAVGVMWVGPGPSHPLGALALVLLLESGLILCAVGAVILNS